MGVILILRLLLRKSVQFLDFLDPTPGFQPAKSSVLHLLQEGRGAASGEEQLKAVEHLALLPFLPCTSILPQELPN